MPLRISVSSRDAFRRLASFALIGLIGTLGCKPPEQVSRYTAPKDPIDVDTISDDPEGDEPADRVLGAITAAGKPGEESWYFFKIRARPKAVERHVAAFNEFIESLKFAENGPPSWTVPAGWREVGSQGPDRIATFKMKKSETNVELAVTRFGGPLLDNINRWRVEQAGVPAITEAEIETKCKVLTVDGHKVVIVDVAGLGGKGGGMKGPFQK